MTIRTEDAELYPREQAERYARQFAVPLAQRFPFVETLFAPVHADSRPGEAPPPADYVCLEPDWSLTGAPAHASAAADLRAFLRATYGITLQPPVKSPGQMVTLDIDASLPAQAYRLDVRPASVHLWGGDAAGVMYAIHRLEELMTPYCRPALPPGVLVCHPVLHTRIYRSPVAPYYVNEAVTGEEYYPEAFLDRLAHHGFNGIWTHVRLRDLARSPLFPDYGMQAEEHLDYLRRLIERAGRYHIGVYLYLTEPLGMADDDTAWAACPHARGARSLLDETFAVCTSLPEVRDHLREGTARLARALPGLGGLIQI